MTTDNISVHHGWYRINPAALCLPAALLSIVLLSMLSGCATVKPPSASAAAPTAIPTAAPVRIYHDAIDLSGRFSVQYQRNNKDEAVHGSFAWSQTSQRTIVTLLSPLGQTLAVIDIKPDMATMTQSDKTTQSAADPDALASRILGWPLPITGLHQWLQGFTAGPNGQPVTAAATPDKETPTLTTADGWRIRYMEWQDDSATTSYPKRIDLARSTQQAGEVSIRIVIDSWLVP